MRIVALLTVRNESLYIDRCLRHLHEQGIETCVIDNQSTDATLDIVERWRNFGVFRVEHLPYPGYFDLHGILENEQRLAGEIEADWFMHYDADEIRESPVVGETLHDAIRRVDQAGFDAINFDEFVFLPCHDDASFEGTDYVQTMRYYYFFEPVPLRQLKGWKKGVKLDLAASGGHRMSRDDLNIAPDRFVMRHYIALSRQYAVDKYTKERIYSPKEVNELGWHGRRATCCAHDLVFPDRQQLKNIDFPWDYSDPCKEHAFLGSDMIAAPFIVGVGRSGTTLLRLMLDAHPDLAIPAETHFLPKLFEYADSVNDCTVETCMDLITSVHTWRDLAMADEDLRIRLSNLKDITATRVAREIYLMYMEGQGKVRWGDKTPLYQLKMPLISKFLPEAHFIHIIRDGRDVALSMRHLWFGPGDDLKKQAKRWVEDIKKCRADARKVPYYLEIRYEDLVVHTEDVLIKICDFIQLPFDESMLHYYRTAEQRLAEIGHRYANSGEVVIDGELRRGIHELTTSQPDASRMMRWKHEMNQCERDAYEGIAGGLLKELGYEI